MFLQIRGPPAVPGADQDPSGVAPLADKRWPAPGRARRPPDLPGAQGHTAQDHFLRKQVHRGGEGTKTVVKCFLTARGPWETLTCGGLYIGRQ